MKYKSLGGEDPTGFDPVKTNQVHKGNWQPWPIRAPYLIFFTLLCVCLTVIAELLVQRSVRDGGLVFGDLSNPASGISRSTDFFCNYLPTIISVLFGLLWATSEHDYKRLEAFFQMSKVGGAIAKDSLLLEYPYSSPISLPWESFKQRHWAVCLSSTMALFSVVFLIPIMPGMIEERDVFKALEAEIPAPIQSTNASKSFSTGSSYAAYSYAWLNGSLPDFTTPEYAIMPFDLSTVENLREDETWIGESTLYEADLKCQKADITQKGWGYQLNNGDDCEYYFVDNNKRYYYPSEYIPEGDVSLATELDDLVAFRFYAPWNSLFMGHASMTVGSGRRIYQDIYTLNSPMSKCSNNSRFLGIWGNRFDLEADDHSSLPEKWTAVYCEPGYWTQSVTATVQVKGENRIVQKVVRLGERKPFSDFNATTFEQLAAIGQTSASPEDLDSYGYPVNLGYPPLEYPNPQYQLLERYGAADPNLTNLVVTVPAVQLLNQFGLGGFALRNYPNDTLSRLLDPVELAKSYSDAYKLLFSFSLASELRNPAVSDTSMKRVTRGFETERYAVSVVWCRLTQAGFIVLALLTLCLLYSTWGRETNLDGEPNSLLESMLSIRTLSQDVTMHNSEFCDPRVLCNSLVRAGHRYQLRLVKGQGPIIEKVTSGSTDQSMCLTPEHIDNSELTPFKPKISWELSRIAGVSYFSFFGFLLVLLIAIYTYSIKNNGDYTHRIVAHPSGTNMRFLNTRLPSVAPTNSFGYKILWSYIPTALGMAIEPLLVLLGAYACMVGPYETLKRGLGQARSSRSLVLDYDKSPPHFQLWQSLKVRNFVLSALTIAILAANFLAVALGGLFSSDSRLFIVSDDLDQSTPLPEMYYVLSGNLSTNSTLPKWTTPEMFILPFNSTKFSKQLVVEQRGTTWGFAANISCGLIPDELIIRNATIYDSDGYNDTVNTLKVSHSCWGKDIFDIGEEPVYDTDLYYWNQNGSPATDFFLKSRTCPGTFFAGWGELPGDPNPRNSSLPYAPNNKTEYVVISCSSNLKVSEVSAVVDGRGIVLSYDTLNSLSQSEGRAFFGWDNTTDPSIDYDSSFQGAIAAFLTIDKDLRDGGSISRVGSGGNNFLNPYTLRWINYLMVEKNPLVRRHLANVTHIPDKENVVKAFTDVYKALYAINLQLHSDEYFEFGATEISLGTSFISKERVTLSTSMFGMAVGILAYFLIVIIYVYWSRPGANLSHMPTTLAATHTLLYASNALEDCARLYGESTKDRALKLLGLGYTYSYGFFVGWDRKQHYGVHKESSSETSSTRSYEEVKPGENEFLMKVEVAEYTAHSP